MAENLAKLERALRQHPDSPLFARLAEGYLRRGMAHRALEVCQRGCAAAPDYPTGHLILGQCYRAQGNHEAAQAALQQALQLDPANPAGLALLADTFMDLQRPIQALTALQQAAAVDPFDRDLHQQLDQLTYKIRVAETLQRASGQEPTTAAGESDEPAPESPEEPPASKATEPVEPPAESAPEPNDRVEDKPEEPPAGAGNAPQAIEPPKEWAPEPPHQAAAPAIQAAPADEASAPPAADQAPSASEPEPTFAPAVDLEWPRQADPPDEQSGDSAPDQGLEPAPDGPAEPPLAERAEDDPSVAVLLPRGDDELIRLFREIEQDQSAEAPEPDPPLPAPALDLADQESRIATATLAEIYSNQGLVQRAIETYQQILEQHPDDEAVRQKLDDLTQRESR